MRIGIGYDIHRLVEGRPLILGGVSIPHEKGLAAHSDGDVVIHALCDALLGAAGLSNIGVMFPDTDIRFKDRNSLELLKIAVETLEKLGYEAVQTDMNVIAQRPKLQPYVPDMRQTVANALGIALDCVSIKPRTNEEVGPEGRQEAISAQAVVVIQKKSAGQ